MPTIRRRPRYGSYEVEISYAPGTFTDCSRARSNTLLT